MCVEPLLIHVMPVSSYDFQLPHNDSIYFDLDLYKQSFTDDIYCYKMSD